MVKMDVQDIERRFEEAYVEDLGDYEVGFLNGKVQKLKAGIWLVSNAELREENKKLKETNFKLLGRLSVYSEQLEKYEQALNEIIETEKRLENLTVTDIAKKALGI
jgi:hypothetical protein